MSEEKKETAVDIVRELETIADNMETAAKAVNDERNRHDTCRVHPHCNRYKEMMREASDTRKLAKRINAAFEREVGDITSKLDEARKCRDLWSARAAELVKKCDEQYDKLKEIGNSAALRNAATEVLSCFDHARQQQDCRLHFGDLVRMDNAMGRMRDSLSSPVRNCDVYATADEAYVAWQEICENESIPPSSKVDSAFKYWLFAPVEKGGV